MASRCPLLVVASVLTLHACDGGGGIELVVELKTDLTPGTEFASAQALLDGEAAASQPAFAGDDFVSGRRIAEIVDVTAGGHELVVQLRDDAGAVVVERDMSLQIEADLGITVVITRDCAGVSCPEDAGGVVLTCHGGRCVPPECSPALPTSCGTPECTGDADCGGCGVCADGVCLAPAVPGCADAGPGDAASDAPASDATTDGGGDATTDARTDGGSPPVCDTTDPGLVACWLFEDDLVDETGRHDLVALAPTFTDSGTSRGQAVEMSMGKELQLVPGTPAPTFTSGTWQMWLLPSIVPSIGRRGLLELDGSYGVFLYADGFLRCRFTMSTGTIATLVSTTRPAAGDWHHLACTVTDGGAQLFVDGVLEDDIADTADLATSTGTFMIGADAPSGTDAFGGDIDSVMLFDYVRSPTQIAADAAP
jgi:hypothetical protein